MGLFKRLFGGSGPTQGEMNVTRACDPTTGQLRYGHKVLKVVNIEER
jgi:hypothetical protein